MCSARSIIEEDAMEKDRALAIVEKAKQGGAMVFVEQADLEAQKMYTPVVTVLNAVDTDFHPIQGGSLMPKSHHTEKIGEAAGIDFIDRYCHTEKIEPYVWVGHAAARRRQPDGQWRQASAEYEFDAELRAEIDAGTNTGPKYEKLFREYRKFGRQRADTGARLRVIRKLTGIPVAFNRNDIKRAFVVSRIAVNSDAMLEDDRTREAAISVAIGATSDVFGPKQAQIEDQTEPAPADADKPIESDAIDISEAQEVDDGFGDEGDTGEVETLGRELEEWLLDDVVGSGEERQAKIREALDSNDPEKMRAMIERCKAYKAKQTGGAA